MPGFAHLHVHSCFSFHDGVDTPAALVERAKELGYSALALTDANGTYGAVPFCTACKEAGIAPLLGAEIDGGDPDGPRAVVLARGLPGYPALCRLVTRRQLDHGDGNPSSPSPGGAERQDPGDSRSHQVSALAQMIAAEAGRVVVLAADPALLAALAPRLPAGTLLGELAYDGSAASASRCRATLAACRALSLPFAATNAVRFARPEGLEVHRLLRAIGENGTLWSVPPRAHPRHFLKSPEEMAALFAHLPGALAAAAHVAEECACAVGFAGWQFPRPHLPPGETPFSLLWQKSFAGLKERYRPLSRAATERLRLELSVIEEKGFSPYFLAVDEIAAQARAWGLRTVGRGSAANSIVSYCLGFTHVDPLEHALFFERFLNPERASPPDIDLDFSWRDRDRLLAWVYERFGADRTALISTHVTFGPRAAVRETGKAHGLPDAELTRLTRRIPHWGAGELGEIAGGAVPECRSLPGDDPTFRRVLDLGARLVGLPRHLSIHAGGVVIAPRPLTDFLPLERAAKGFVVTQYDMGPVEALGLIKIDLLSQRSLGVLQDAAAAVAAHTGAPPPVDERATVLADPATRRLIREGRTMGCFYVESPAMRSLLRKLGTETFEELTAASSVIRPGVAESGMMQEYIRRHHAAREATGAGTKLSSWCPAVPGEPAPDGIPEAIRPSTGSGRTGGTGAGGVARSGGPGGNSPFDRLRANGGNWCRRGGAERGPRGRGAPSEHPRGAERQDPEGNLHGGSAAELVLGGPGKASPRQDPEGNLHGNSADPVSWYADPRLEPVLRETHGVMIYQEDVLRVAHTLAGMSLGQADTLRRSMSGKLRSPEAMARVREGFIHGCAANGVAPAVALEVWRQVESFAGYAFCKAHSASYALLSFQVAYLKAHHPAEFMAAVVSNQGGFYGTAAYLAEARRMGLALLLPDVNRSEREYTGRGREIRMGLMAFSGLEEAAIDRLLAARRAGGPFTNLSDLLARGGVGRTELELLVRGGACDGFELTRPELLWRLACRCGATGRDLFPGAGGLDHLVPRLPEYGVRERCRMEEEIFGFPVTRHPLELADEDPAPGPLPARGARAAPLVTADRMARFAGRSVRMRGLVISYKRIPTKRAGAWMKFLSCEDLTGTFEAVLFPAAYARYAEATLGEGPFLLAGRVEVDHGVPALTAERLETLGPPRGRRRPPGGGFGV